MLHQRYAVSFTFGRLTLVNISSSYSEFLYHLWDLFFQRFLLMLQAYSQWVRSYISTLLIQTTQFNIVLILNYALYQLSAHSYVCLVDLNLDPAFRKLSCPYYKNHFQILQSCNLCCFVFLALHLGVLEIFALSSWLEFSTELVCLFWKVTLSEMAIYRAA